MAKTRSASSWQEAKGEAKERVGGATGAHETGSEQARLGSPLTSPGSEVALLLREPAAPGTVISPRGPAAPGAMTPLMGGGDLGAMTPLMGPAEQSQIRTLTRQSLSQLFRLTLE